MQPGVWPRPWRSQILHASGPGIQQCGQSDVDKREAASASSEAGHPRSEPCDTAQAGPRARTRNSSVLATKAGQRRIERKEPAFQQRLAPLDVSDFGGIGAKSVFSLHGRSSDRIVSGPRPVVGWTSIT